MTSPTRVAFFVGVLGVQALAPHAATAQSLVQAAKAAVAQSAAAQAFSLTSTREDPASGQLVIVGSGFRPGIDVVLNGARLRVLAVLSHEIRAELPTLLPGSYRLVVDQRRGGTQRFVVTLGTGTSVPGPAGPQGPMGPQGAAGPQGLRGLNGPGGVSGPAGAAGSAGASGVAGPAGPIGPAGIAGAPGAVGLQGLQGAPGPQGLQGVAGPPGIAGGLTVMASNGATLGTLLTPGMSGQPSLVALQDRGIWLMAPVNPDGIAPMAFYALYADAACATAPYVPLDTNPAPLLRLLQTVNAGDTTAYYAGNPTEVRVSASLSLLGQPAQCEPTAGTGWDQPMLAGPLQTFDLSRFPARFTIR